MQVDPIEELLKARYGKLLGLVDSFNDVKINVRDIRVDGSNVHIDFDAEEGGDISFRYGGTWYTLDCTTGDGPDGLATVILLQGTDEVPQFNFVHMLFSASDGKAIPLVSQKIPKGGFGPVCYCLCPTAAMVAASGSIYIHRISDVATDGERGAESYARELLRLGKTDNRIEGCDIELVITTNGASRDNIHVISSPGEYYQLHKHENWVGYNSSTYGIRAIGQKVGACAITNNKMITDIGLLAETSQGVAIADGETVIVDITGIGTSCSCKRLAFQVSSQAFATPAEAITFAKSSGPIRYTKDVRHLCFTLGRMVLTYSSANGGTWTNALSAATEAWQTHAVNEGQTGYPGYTNNQNEIFSNHTYVGASAVRARIQVDTEANWDFITIRNGTDPFPTTVSERRRDPLSFSGDLGNILTPEIAGDTMRVQIVADGSVIDGEGGFVFEMESLEAVTPDAAILDMR